MADLIIQRQLNADQQQVFDAWATAGNMAQWWGQKGYATGIENMRRGFGGRFNGLEAFLAQQQTDMR